MNECILAIDDDARNLKLIECYLEEEGYRILTAPDGEAGWSVLQQHAARVDLILLDRMMPNLDGIAFLQRFRQHPEYKHIPVIMQTAASEPAQIREGLELGVFYYLVKPYEEEVLVSLSRAAIEDSRRNRELLSAMQQSERTFAMVREMCLEFHTLDEARMLATTLASFFPDPKRVVTGISELLINAVEHGNLGIRYHEKTALMMSGQWLAEIERRLHSPDYRDRRVLVRMRRDGRQVELQIDDEGAGFDWRGYLDFKAERASDPHGRGIAMARMLSFDELAYQGRGNSVICRVNLPAPH